MLPLILLCAVSCNYACVELLKGRHHSEICHVVVLRGRFGSYTINLHHVSALSRVGNAMRLVTLP